MNEIILLHGGCSPTTIGSVSQRFGEIQTATAKPPVSRFLFQIKEHTRSPRNGRFRVSVESAMAEGESVDVRQKKVEARQFIANEIMQAVPPDSLAKLRLSRGLSQQDLARLTCTSQSHIAKIEAGSVKMFLDTAIKLADALGVSLDQLRNLVRTEKVAAQVSAI